MYRGEWYCIPETYMDNKVTLFRMRKGPNDWEKLIDIIVNFDAVDSTVYHYDGRFWLFCTRASKEPVTELYLWWAPRLMGPWQPHQCNPVKCDVRSARPAGPLFENGGDIYRPAQDCSRTYGGGLAINRIDVLTPEKFGETVVKRIGPVSHSFYTDGIHTLASLGKFVLLDGKRNVFSVADLTRRVSRHLRKFRFFDVSMGILTGFWLWVGRG